MSRPAAGLAAGFRSAYAAVFGVAISHLALAVDRLSSPAEVLQQIETFHTQWQVGLVLFAAHLGLIGYLAFRSGYLPRFLGVLLVVAGLGYAVDGLGTVLVAGYSASVGSVTFVGEVVLIVWLLVKGVRRRDGRADQDPGVGAVVLDDPAPARKPAGLQH